MEGGSIKEVLGEMKNMLNTPIKAYNMAHSGAASTTPGTSPFSPPPSPDSEIVEGNLPGQFCRLMGKGKHCNANVYVWVYCENMFEFMCLKSWTYLHLYAVDSNIF